MTGPYPRASSPWASRSAHHREAVDGSPFTFPATCGEMSLSHVTVWTYSQPCSMRRGGRWPSRVQCSRTTE